MKLKQLATLGITSVILLGSLSPILMRSATAFPEPAPDSTQILTRTILARGTFVTTEQDHPTTGTANIVNENGNRYIEFDGAFSTATGPDVRVILSRQEMVPVKPNAKDYIILAPLKSVTGAQRYAIPPSVNLKEFKSVGIWCNKFNVTFGYASL